MDRNSSVSNSDEPSKVGDFGDYVSALGLQTDLLTQAMKDVDKVAPMSGRVISKSLNYLGLAIDYAQYREAKYSIPASIGLTATQYGVTAVADAGLSFLGAALTGLAAMNPATTEAAAAIPYGTLATIGATNYAIGNVFHTMAEYTVDTGWHIAGVGGSLNPYSGFDPELGANRYSGYYGLDTGFDTPHENIPPQTMHDYISNMSAPRSPYSDLSALEALHDRRDAGQALRSQPSAPIRSESTLSEQSRRAAQTAGSARAAIGHDPDGAWNATRATPSQLAADRAALADRQDSLAAHRNPSAINNYAGTSLGFRNPERFTPNPVSTPTDLGGLPIGKLASTTPQAGWVDFRYDPAATTPKYEVGKIYTPLKYAVAAIPTVHTAPVQFQLV